MAILSSINAGLKKTAAPPITTRVDTRGNIVPLEGKQTTRSATYKKTAKSAPAPTPAPVLPPTTDSTGFASDVMRMIAGMPSGPQRDNILSTFQQIQSLPVDQQKKWFDSLMTQAETATKPKYEQDVTRTNQQYGYEQSGNKRNQKFADENYKRVVQNIDMNALRQKAQDNKVLGDTLARITSDSFVTNLAGSGIVNRRMQIGREAAQQNAQNNDIEVGQKKGDLQAQLDQYVEGQGAALDRSKQLQKNDLSDLEQENRYGTQSLFLDLFKNEADDTQQQLMNGISPAQTTDTTSTSSVKKTGAINQKTAPGTTMAQRAALRGLSRKGNTFL